MLVSKAKVTEVIPSDSACPNHQHPGFPWSQRLGEHGRGSDHASDTHLRLHICQCVRAWAGLFYLLVNSILKTIIILYFELRTREFICQGRLATMGWSQDSNQALVLDLTLLTVVLTGRSRMVSSIVTQSSRGHIVSY